MLNTQIYIQQMEDKFEAFKRQGLVEESKINDTNLEEYVELANFIDLLVAAGVDKTKIKELLRFREEQNQPAQILMLKKFRANVLEEVHIQQELVDKLDYIIADIKKTGKQMRRA